MTQWEELMVGLLGRVAFPPKEIQAAITRGKKQPDAYVHGYNSCDGKHSVGETAKVVGVTAGTLVPILQQWEAMGIIFEVPSETKGKFYKHLYSLED